MCGKFTAMASWSEVVEFSQVLETNNSGNDRIETLRVMSDISVITFDHEAGKRRVVPMRWGFPKPGNWKVPQPIHARSENIEDTHPHKYAFFKGQRGIVLAKTFNEAPDLPGKSVQHVITPSSEPALALAFVWDRFEFADLPARMIASLMVTVPASKLIATLPTDRMPAVLSVDDWSVWLGENDTPVDAAKNALRTVEGDGWTIEREVDASRARQGELF